MEVAIDYGSKFSVVWIIVSLAIGLFGTVLYKAILEMKQEKLSKQQYVIAYVISFVFGLIFTRGIFYLAL